MLWKVKNRGSGQQPGKPHREAMGKDLREGKWKGKHFRANWKEFSERGKENAWGWLEPFSKAVWSWRAEEDKRRGWRFAEHWNKCGTR